jgi:hypothetical protein
MTVVRKSNHEEIYATKEVLAPELLVADTHAISLQPWRRRKREPNGHTKR